MIKQLKQIILALSWAAFVSSRQGHALTASLVSRTPSSLGKTCLIRSLSMDLSKFLHLWPIQFSNGTKAPFNYLDNILITQKYQTWYESLIPKDRAQVEARLLKVADEGHFGHIKKLDDNLGEFKWNGGLRVYYTFIKYKNQETLVLFLGGNKNSQQYDIRNARRMVTQLQKIK